MTYYLFPKTFIIHVMNGMTIPSDITPFRIENSQSASPSSFISVRKAGDLNEKRCNTSTVCPKEWFSPSLHYYLSNILQQLQKIKMQQFISTSIEHLSNTYYSLCNNENASESPNFTETKTISKINIGGTNRLFFYELLELFQTLHLSMDMYSPIRIFFMGDGNMNISALQSIQRIRNNSLYDNYFLFESEPLNAFLRETPNRVTSIRTTEQEQNSKYFTISNLDNCISKYESSMELIISDAVLPIVHSIGISHNYIQDQEYQITRIAMLQVCFALCMQKKNGIFILKLGNCFSPLSLDLICILSSFYNKTYFTKPIVSDSSSSVRFIVCKGFMYDQIKEYYPILKNIFERVLSTGLFTGPSSVYLSRFLKWNIPKLFILKIEEINFIFGQPQLEQLQHIHSVLTHKYKQDKINHFIKSNTQKCIQWCIKYKIPFLNV